MKKYNEFRETLNEAKSPFKKPTYTKDFFIENQNFLLTF